MFVTRQNPTRRSVLKSAVLGSVAAIATPYVKDTYAAGTVSIGAWDHWIPDANGALTSLCNEWGAKNNVEVKIDYITSQGDKLPITASAEAQAGTGHDIMHHPVWNIGVHADKLEPLDEVAGELIHKYGPINPEFEYLGKIKGTWRGIPSTRACLLYPCCSRLDLYKTYVGIDLRDIFPADESKWNQAKLDTWSWDTYLTSAEKLYKAGYPVGLPMGQTNDSVNWVGAVFRAYGVVMVDAKDNITVNSDETRAALEYLKKLMAVNPREVYAWDDAGNNRWLISGRGAGIMNPQSAWAVAKRDNLESGGELLASPDAERPEGSLRRRAAELLRVVEFLQEQIRGEGAAALPLAKACGHQARGSLVRL